MNEATMVNSPEKGEGVLQELLRTAVLKDIMRNCLNNIDPKNGPATVKTLLWEDTEVVLALMGALPAIINWHIGFFSEMGKQLNTAFPPHLLKSFAGNIWKEIDREELKAGLNAYGNIIAGIIQDSPELKDSIINAVKGPGAAAIGKGITAAMSSLNKVHEENPKLIGDIISNIISNIDKEEFTKGTTILVDAVLDQKLPIFSWSIHLMWGRIRRKFRSEK